MHNLCTRSNKLRFLLILLYFWHLINRIRDAVLLCHQTWKINSFVAYLNHVCSIRHTSFRYRFWNQRWLRFDSSNLRWILYGLTSNQTLCTIASYQNWTNLLNVLVYDCFCFTLWSWSDLRLLFHDTFYLPINKAMPDIYQLRNVQKWWSFHTAQKQLQIQHVSQDFCSEK